MELSTLLIKVVHKSGPITEYCLYFLGKMGVTKFEWSTDNWQGANDGWEKENAFGSVGKLEKKSTKV